MNTRGRTLGSFVDLRVGQNGEGIRVGPLARKDTTWAEGFSKMRQKSLCLQRNPEEPLKLKNVFDAGEEQEDLP